VVLNFRRLVSALESSTWVDWDRAEPSGSACDGHGCSGNCSLVPPADSAGMDIEPSAPPQFPQKVPEAPCNMGADFLGNGPSAADLQPSAPPPPDAAPCSRQSISEQSLEIFLDGTDLGRSPFHDLGALAIYSPPWSPSYLITSRPFVLVLRHPREPKRGIRLLEAFDCQAVLDAARTIAAHMGLEDGNNIQPEIYAALLSDPELRESLASLHAQIVQDGAGAGSSSSSSNHALVSAPTPSSGAASSSDAAPSTTSAFGVPEPSEGACGDCPICFCEIEPSAAAMRCSGQGGQHHYFHSECMQQWIAQCRSGRGGATCPICRGSIQFHAQRLDQFLSGNASASLTQEDRTFLQQCSDRLKSAGGSWGEAFTLENAAHYGGLVAAGGWGFMLGYTQPPITLQHDLTLSMMPREHRIAQGIGWVLGAITRVAREHYKEKARNKKK